MYHVRSVSIRGDLKSEIACFSHARQMCQTILARKSKVFQEICIDRSASDNTRKEHRAEGIISSCHFMSCGMSVKEYSNFRQVLQLKMNFRS